MSSKNDFVAYADYASEDEIDFSPVKRVKKNTVHKSSHSRQDPLTNQIIFTKGDTSTDSINLDELRKKISHLKANADVKIRKLNGKLKEDFDFLAQSVAWVYNTDSYKQLYNEIKKYFNDKQSYQPGTVGAYCGGCLNKRKDGLPTRGCSVICAGSIPPPLDDPEWEFCEDLVIWSTYEGGNYEFTSLNEVDDAKDNRVIIFIDQNSLDSFPGFSSAEKKTLADYGIKQVRIMHYNPKLDCKAMYTDISKGFIALDKIKSRQATTQPPASTSNQNAWLWLVVFILFILILLFLNL